MKKDEMKIAAPQEQETFKLTKQRTYNKSKDMLLRAYVPNETYELFVQVQKATGIKMPVLSGMCIEYALQHLELLEPR